MNTNQPNVRRMINLPEPAEKKSEVNVTNDNFPGYDASTAAPRFPRCVKACPSRRSRGWRRSGRNTAA